MDWRTSLKIHPIESVPFRVALLPDHDWSRLATNGSFVEIFFQVEEASTITHVGTMLRDDITFSVGGIPGDFVMTLEGISDSGVADGVVKAQTAQFTPDPSQAETFLWRPLLATYSAQRGEKLCLKITKNSGGGSLFGTRVIHFGSVGFPYQRWFTGSGTLISSGGDVYGYRTATRRYGWPIKFFRQVDGAINSPGQTGMRFLFSDEIAQNAVLSHITWIGRPNVTAGGSYAVAVYDDMGATLSRVTISVDHGAQTMSGAAGGRDFSSTVYFEDAPTIEFGREYFVMLEPSGSQALYVAAWTFNDALDAAALGGEGEFYGASRSTGSGSFSVDTTVRPLIDLGFFDWGIAAPPLTGFHLKFFPRYNDNALIEHADDQVVDPRETVEGEPHEAPGFPIGNAIKSYCGFATVEVFRNPEGTFDASTRIRDEMPIEEAKLINWDPFVAADSHLVFRFRAVAGSSSFVDIDQYARLI